MTITPTIDPEFSALIPPLAPDELAQLEANIVQDGCRDPLTVWRGVLLDGHNRFAICQRNGLTFSTVAVELDSRDEALMWIIRNQFGRRNLPAIDRVSLALQAEPIVARLAKANMQAGGESAGRGRPQQGLPNLANPKPIDTRAEVAKQAGVSHGTYDSAKRVIDAVKSGALPSDTIDKIRSGEQSISGVAKSVARDEQTIKRKAHHEALKQSDLPTGKYRVFYADPPWQYNDSGVITESDSYGRAERHYPTMSLDSLCELGAIVKDMSDDNAVLFMWVTSPLLEDGFRVIKSWGFEYKTSFVWDKVKHNFGHYNSVRHEFLLICTRGSCTPDNLKLFDSVQSIERSEVHSEKPEEFRDIIDTLYTYGSKIELFSRTAKHGWDCWGNEAG